MDDDKEDIVDVDDAGADGEEAGAVALVSAISTATFAPRDVQVEEYTAKDNVFGIGYKPLSAKVSTIPLFIVSRSLCLVLLLQDTWHTRG
jgi:hypothetical protein